MPCAGVLRLYFGSEHHRADQRARLSNGQQLELADDRLLVGRAPIFSCVLLVQLIFFYGGSATSRQLESMLVFAR